MLGQLIYLFLTFLITLALYPVWISFVYRFHLGEKIREDGPQTHLKKLGTPTMGGLVFIITVSLITFIFNRSRTQTLFPIFVASMAGLFGLIEDFSKLYNTTTFKREVGKNISGTFIYKLLLKPWYLFKEFWRVVGSNTDRGLQTYQKFLIQSLIGGFVSYWTYFKLGWDYIWLPLLGDVHIGIIYPITIFVLFVVILNFVAFTDGIDGLAGGLSLFSFGAFWILSTFLGYKALGTLSATFIGALLPFLYFNVNPARIFMGNVGSHVLGSTLTVLAVVMHREVALLFIIGVFLIDGISSPLQQISVKLTGKRIFRMAPLHHHFELLGWSESKVMLRFWLFGMLLSFVGVFIGLS